MARISRILDLSPERTLWNVSSGKNRNGVRRVGNWWREDRAYINADDSVTLIVTIGHYSTPMLSLGYVRDAWCVLDYWLGRGSVSDQNGVNTILRDIGSSLYYSRRGGAHYVEPF